MKILVETSARHLHVSPEHLEILFGKGATLTKKKDLSQPGQYASEQKVTVVGPKKELANVTILGPCRACTQVEISLTDARSIGITCPIRESGDIGETSGCKLIGPNGTVTIDEGVIVAKRHLHTTPADAQILKVTDKQIVKIMLDTDQRKCILDDVVVRISEKFATAVHIDTDESNAANCQGDTYCTIIK